MKDVIDLPFATHISSLPPWTAAWRDLTESPECREAMVIDIIKTVVLGNIAEAIQAFRLALRARNIEAPELDRRFGALPSAKEQPQKLRPSDQLLLTEKFPLLLALRRRDPYSDLIFNAVRFLGTEEQIQQFAAEYQAFLAELGYGNRYTDMIIRGDVSFTCDDPETRELWKRALSVDAMTIPS